MVCVCVLFFSQRIKGRSKHIWMQICIHVGLVVFLLYIVYICVTGDIKSLGYIREGSCHGTFRQTSGKQVNHTRHRKNRAVLPT